MKKANTQCTMFSILFVCVLIVGMAPGVFAGPHFLIDSYLEWKEGNIRPMMAEEWDTYMDQWHGAAGDNVEGAPYPSTQFMEAQLSVYPGDTEWDDGLVMMWGGEQVPPGEYASAFVFDYGVDPDLSNCTIRVMVNAPTGINGVSFGIRDMAGLRRSWWWSVPGAIAPNVPTLVTINTAVTGLAAATPPATGYMNTPGFDIRTTQFLDVDENGTWVGTTPAPPPGLPGYQGLWNYWYQLSVTPNTDSNKWFHRKWSQPPVEISSTEPPTINGWDEKSLYIQPPIVADDWLCEDERPITDFHWWGSFLGWTQPGLPQVVPKAFHIAIWTDVPVGPSTPFSHPGKMIWEHICDKWVWNFAGYDLDPQNRPEYRNEACFQFTQLLSQDEWFYQEPGSAGGNVYWVSIAAIYEAGVEVQYPWGWKTRPHYFNDDAVQIHQVVKPDGTVAWPPTLGDEWDNGLPIEFPLGVSWDVAFELSTNLPASQ